LLSLKRFLVFGKFLIFGILCKRIHEKDLRLKLKNFTQTK